eukprot:4059740-Amphidinium_carterae.2
MPWSPQQGTSPRRVALQVRRLNRSGNNLPGNVCNWVSKSLVSSFGSTQNPCCACSIRWRALRLNHLNHAYNLEGPLAG